MMSLSTDCVLPVLYIRYDLWKNIGALPGDRLILTKPVGTGILTTALKADFLSRDEGQEVIRVMSWLNKYARDAVADLEIHACTDITGFGLAGHCLEILHRAVV